MNIVSKFQVPGFSGMGVKYGDLNIGRKWMNELVSYLIIDKCVQRITTATLGLLIIVSFLQH